MITYTTEQVIEVLMSGYKAVDDTNDDECLCGAISKDLIKTIALGFAMRDGEYVKKWGEDISW